LELLCHFEIIQEQENFREAQSGLLRLDIVKRYLRDRCLVLRKRGVLVEHRTIQLRVLLQPNLVLLDFKFVALLYVEQLEIKHICVISVWLQRFDRDRLAKGPLADDALEVTADAFTLWPWKQEVWLFRSCVLTVAFNNVLNL
jgi:hypothetical protein